MDIQQQALLTALFEMGRSIMPPVHPGFEGLTKGEFFLLNMVYDHTQQHPEVGGMYVSELLERLRVTPPAISRMLRGMEGKGYLERVVDRQDRRTTYVTLKPEGVRLRREAEQRALEFSQRILAQLGQEDAQQLVALWQRMKEIVHQELAKER